MRSIEAEAKSKEEAISRALEDLSLTRSQVQVEVLEEGSRGFLGVGGKPVRVRVSELDASAEGPVAVVRTLLELMGVEFNLAIDKDEEATNVKVEAPKDEGLLIGRRGQTLDAIRHVAQRIIAAKEGREVVVNIDVGDYRARREEALRERGREAAEEVVKEERSVTLEPMSAQDRRVVHLSLADREDLHTYTVGNGARRRVVIAPGARGSRRPSRELGTFADDGHTPESAYDGVPDPGFKPSRIESGAIESAPHQERRVEESGEDRRPPRQRRQRSRSRGGRDDGARDERGSRDGEGRFSRSRDERREEDSAPHGREEGREESRDSRPREESRSSHSRDEGRGNRRGPRRRDDRRDDRHAGDRSRSRDEGYHAYDDEGSQEPGATELSQVPEVTDDSQEKAFPSTLARQILQLEEKKGGEEKPAPSGRRRPRRR